MSQPARAVFHTGMETNEDFDKGLAEAIYRRRTSLRLSQASAAERARFHVNTWGKIERAEQTVRVGQLRDIARALDTTMDVLAGEAEQAVPVIRTAARRVPMRARRTTP